MPGTLTSILCIFCGGRFSTASATKTRRLRVCPYCRKGFFYYKGYYYVRLQDLDEVKIPIVKQFLKELNQK